MGNTLTENPKRHLSPVAEGRRVAQSILEAIEKKHTLSEGDRPGAGSKAFKDAKSQLKAVGMHIHDTGWGDYRVVHNALKKDPDKGSFHDDLDDALQTGLSTAPNYDANGKWSKSANK